MNIIEKRKGQLKFLGILIILIAIALAVTGIVLLAKSINIALGIILLVLSVLGLPFGVVFTWVASSVKATNGSIAEDNLGKGTVNMHKCENCGAEVEAGKTICAKCEENLK